MAEDGAAGERCPFKLFPRELWDMILQEVENSQDILEIIEIFPQLQGLTRGNEFSWLIGEVIPFILPKFLNFNHDIKSCRLVSKRWKNSIESTYETHPERLPYNSPKVGKVTEHHFCYHPLPEFKININKFIESGMANDCQLDHNPFPGRLLKIKIDLPRIQESDNIRFDNVLQMLKQFGHHVFYIRFVPRHRGKWDMNLFVQDYINNAIKCLVHLPNLRSLTLEGFRKSKSGKVPDSSSVAIESIALIPILHHLEMLDISSNLSELSKDIFFHLVNGLAKGGSVRMLGVYDQYWETRYKNMFPNLTELRLSAGRQVGEQTIANILQELRAPNLRKLRLDFDWIDVCILARILVPYQIETLEVSGYRLYESDVDEVIVPSIKHFKFMANPYTELLFLKIFSNLEYLSIKYDDADSDGWEEEDEIRDVENLFARGIRHYLLEFKTNLSQRDIVWDTLPKLKMITVYGNPIRFYLRDSPNNVYKAFNSNLAAIFNH